MTNETDVLHRAIAEFGTEAQVDMMIEEMSELTKALLKLRRVAKGQPHYDDSLGACDIFTSSVLEEMADVQIMLDQMKLIYDRYGLFEQWRNKKLGRLDGWLERQADEKSRYAAEQRRIEAEL